MATARNEPQPVAVGSTTELQPFGLSHWREWRTPSSFQLNFITVATQQHSPLNTHFPHSCTSPSHCRVQASGRHHQPLFGLGGCLRKNLQPNTAATCPPAAYSRPPLFFFFFSFQESKYKAQVDDAISYAKGKSKDLAQQVELASDKLFVNFGKEILKLVPGRVSTEVDARYALLFTSQVLRPPVSFLFQKEMPPFPLFSHLAACPLTRTP